LIVMLLLLWSCRQKQELIQPVVRDITESVYASGIIKSNNQHEVFSPVNGIISQVHVREGDLVRKGAVIITLNNEAAKLNAEHALIASTYASPGLNREKLEELGVNIQVARSNMYNDSLLLQRQQNLWKEEIGTRNELEQRALKWRNAVSTYQAAILRYKELQRQIKYSSLTSAKQLSISRVMANDYMIRADRDGKIYSLLKEPGEMVNTQAPVAVIGNPNNFLLELKVDEYDISKVKIGQKVFISMDSYKDDVFEAVVGRIIPIMNQNSRSFTIEASFTEIPPGLYPNLTAEANILVSSKKDVITIPRNFLMSDNEVILKNGKKRKLVIGLKDYEVAEVVSGLAKTDIIRKPMQE
jgi:HlyD family secretion protein